MPIEAALVIVALVALLVATACAAMLCRMRSGGNAPVWLPLDWKFPSEDYERLEDARQRGDIEAVEIASRAIENAIRIAARDITAKYIHSPHSTDFAVLFLPTEGLFAEVIRRPGLVDAPNETVTS
jgi:DNA recombination protein RmuC